MALETATYISDLVSANPATTDGFGQTDDHIRLIKAAVKATFPNIAGAVTVTQDDLNNLKLGQCPVGSIILFDGDVATLPTNWAVCDGTLGTPDLRDKFVVGSSATKAAKSTGGAESVTGSTSTDGAHNHDVSQAPTHSHGGSTGGHALTIAELAAHDHGLGGKDVFTYTGGGGNSGVNNGTTYQGVGATSQGSGQAHSHPISADGAHTHTVSGGAHAHTLTVATVPPYYAVVYIRRMS